MDDLRDITTRWLAVSGLRVRCLTAGARGPAVLLLHGGGLDAAGLSFRAVIPALATRFSVVAPDWPGYGESDPVPAGWHVAEHLTYLGGVMSALGIERASLVGHSMGGQFALGFALAAPQRVERLVLIDSGGLSAEVPGGMVGYLSVHIPLLSQAPWWLIAHSRFLLRWSMVSAMPHRPELVTDTLLAELRQLARKPNAGEAFRQFQRHEVRPTSLATSYVDRLRDITVPTLIINGANDPLVCPEAAERVHRLIAGSQLVLLPRCGHLAPLEQPEACSGAILRFLTPVV